MYPTDQETVRGLHVRTQTTTKTGFRRQGDRNCQVKDQAIISFLIS